MKGAILNCLAEAGDRVSGETLSARLGISRVAVWKHIQQLQELGYRIDAGRKGYRLDQRPDAPYPWEFPNREDRIHYFPEVDSTMDAARELARKGCAHMTVVVADCQRRGRGRLKRTWRSDAGGLYLTVVTRPELPPMFGSRVTFAAALAVSDAMAAVCRVSGRLKWPNDVLVDGKKAVGMLSEMEAEADRITHLNLGVGINVNNDPSKREPNAVSLKSAAGRPVSRIALMGAFLDYFEERLGDAGTERIIADWKARSDTLGRRVRVETVRQVHAGLARDVDPTGALILEMDDGTTRSVVHGDCFHR